MENEELVISDDLETTESEGETEEAPAPTPEELAELKAKAAKADELEEKNKQLFERAKKAEGKQEQKGTELSGTDALILAKSDAHEDDLDTILDYAKFKKQSIAEAMKDTTLRTILEARAEERRTEAATHVNKGQRGSAKVSGEDLLLKAEKTGEVPDTDEGMQALFQARLARKIPKRK